MAASHSLSHPHAARAAALACLLGMAIVMFSHYALTSPLLVAGDAVATAANVVAHERAFRAAALGDVLYGGALVVLSASLYLVLAPVHRGVALVAAALRIVYAIMWVVTALHALAALRILGDVAYLHAFPAEQLQVLSRLDLAANFDTYYVGLPFFGAASTLCSPLWLRSGLVPRWLAVFGVVASAWCVACAVAYLVFPRLDDVLDAYWFDTPLGVFEIAISVWLLVKARRSPAIERGLLPQAATSGP